MKFIVFTCVYNGQEYIGRCLESVRNQSYKNYDHVIVDDASTDRTPYIIAEYEYNGMVYYRNLENVKWVRNALRYLDRYIHSDEDVIVILDGDDALKHNEVLNRVRAEYEEGAWMTYSRFEYESGGNSSWIPIYNEDILTNKRFRDVTWSFTHLRTFKAFLWRALNKDDLRGPNGEYTPYTYDQALLFPMLEMCEYGRIHFIDEILYVYNDLNPLQVEKYDKRKQQALGMWFRSRPRYGTHSRYGILQ